MVKWTGEARYTYKSTRDEDTNGKKTKENADKLQFRLYPTAEVNQNWHVKARLTAKTDMSSDKGDDGNVKLTYVYAEGQYGNFDVKLGKQELFSTADAGLVVDDYFSGAAVTFGKDFKTTLEAGRWNLENANDNIHGDYDATTKKYSVLDAVNDHAANYQGAEFNYAPNKLRLGASYRHFNDAAFKDVATYSNGTSKSDDANIWSVGAGYKFDHNWDLFGAFAQTRKLTTTTRLTTSSCPTRARILPTRHVGRLCRLPLPWRERRSDADVRYVPDEHEGLGSRRYVRSVQERLHGCRVL